jgi:putative Mg2+ transporter-C (MgtC) family protein
LGGLIGAEREARDKSAGFRTIILISLGATLFTMLSLFLSKSDDPTRIAANIVTGIGFLGAGAILRHNEQVSGLTTAATIWLAAAVGMAVGAGHYVLSLAVTSFTLVVLWVFPTLESKIDNLRHLITYHVQCEPSAMTPGDLEAIFSQQGLKLYKTKRTKAEGLLTFEFETFGPPDAHDRLVQHLLQDERVKEFVY